MRLLDTTSLQLGEFVADIPSYAILSHTWGGRGGHLPGADGNPSTPQLTRILDHTPTQRVSEIIDFCRQARADDFEWAWADTCCIDKTSSAELSEAINSMYKVVFLFLGLLCLPPSFEPQPAG
ncbi:hypothetical protein QBC37DRAFT_102697 [Rhypophila decipiens]|uniref:Heterokaryon incompatibility domain-containing protein n=1 Tax=Rhypophila decipiens TaxID=261697 RepID=A0AAN6XUC5_9PEZI|nr:hypothetical protein QBC37DRAFT_102697 [Rhypophila decipiens]